MDTIVQTWAIVQRAQVGWVLAALAFYVSAWLAGGWRWQLIVNVLGSRVAFIHAALATIACVAVNNLTPTGRVGGEAARIAMTRLRSDISLARSALASVCDRLLDLPAAAVVFLIALPVLPALAGGHVLAAAVAGLALLIVGLLAGRWLRARLHASLTEWQQLGVRVAPRVVVAVVTLSLLVWGQDVLRLLAIGRAFGVPLTVAQCAALNIVSLLGGFVPTIGGLGAVEGALVGTLLLFGVTLETALAITALERSITFGFSTALGGGVAAWFGGRRLLRPDAAATS
ncbi:MAG: YbhN family protein [Vicinamibacterales bacterium]